MAAAMDLAVTPTARTVLNGNDGGNDGRCCLAAGSAGPRVMASGGGSRDVSGGGTSADDGSSGGRDGLMVSGRRVAVAQYDCQLEKANTVTDS